MKILRNPELRRELLAFAGVTSFAALPGFRIGPAAALLVLVTGAFFCALWFAFARRRYQRMGELAGKLDEILHGQRQILLTDSEEGELAILQSEIRKMTLRLAEQADQLSADKRQLKEAIEDIFHQIRTPLTSMNLLASLLGTEKLSDERRLDLARELKIQLARVQWLVETLLKLSKIDAGTAKFRKERVFVRQMLAEAAEPLLIPLELRQMAYVVRAGEESFLGDRRWTAEAFANLLKNCMEHTPEGGRITVTARETALFTEITVEDTGEGFREEELPRMFDSFYKGGNAAEGSVGIGLALARSIVTAQNGTLKAENTAEGGARFIARFYKGVV